MSEEKGEYSAERRSVIGFALKLLGEFLLCVVFLWLVGWMLEWKMGVMLNRSMENTASGYAGAMAHLAGERFRREIDELQTGARLLSVYTVAGAKLFVNFKCLIEYGSGDNIFYFLFVSLPLTVVRS